MKKLFFAIVFLFAHAIALADTVNMVVTLQPTSTNQTGFRVYLNNGGTYQLLGTLAANATSYTHQVTGSAGSVWCFAVSAFNAVGESVRSPDGCASIPTTTPPPSSNIKLVLSAPDPWWSIDRIGCSALAPNGKPDPTFHVVMTGGTKTITRLRMTDGIGGIYDTAGGAFVLGAASTVTAPLYNSSPTAINFSVADGGWFKLFFCGENGAWGNSAARFTLTATFSDGTTAQGTY